MLGSKVGGNMERWWWDEEGVVEQKGGGGMKRGWWNRKVVVGWKPGAGMERGCWDGKPVKCKTECHLLQPQSLTISITDICNSSCQ